MIDFLQQFDDPTFYLIMRFFSFLGDEPFYIVLLPVLFWCWNKEVTWPLAIVLGLEFYLNFVLKEAFHSPRPVGTALVEAYGFGFPSGHAQNAVVLWGYLAWMTKSNFWLAGIVVFLIALSRFYLGVHFPTDVVGGWALGFLWLFICVAVIGELERRRFHLSPLPAIALIFLVSFWLMGIYPNDMSVRIGGAVTGFMAGALLERSSVRFGTEGSPITQVMKVAVGGGGVVLIKEGLGLFFPDTLPFHYLRYGSVGFWIGFGAPWLFVKLRLSSRS